MNELSNNTNSNLADFPLYAYRLLGMWNARVSFMISFTLEIFMFKNWRVWKSLVAQPSKIKFKFNKPKLIMPIACTLLVLNSFYRF